jgi:hypothetical protein
VDDDLIDLVPSHKHKPLPTIVKNTEKPTKKRHVEEELDKKHVARTKNSLGKG